MHKTLRELSVIVGGEVAGDDSIIITGVSGIREAKEGDITFVANPKYAHLIQETHASAIITSRDVTCAPKPIIRTDNPSLAFAKIVSLISLHQTKHPKGIHPSVILGKDVVLGRDISIGPYTVIGDNVSIGGKTIIYNGCFIGHDSKIGSDSLIYAHVSIRERVVIGNRVVIHCGAVIGSDGFGFLDIDGLHQRIPQAGTVVIEDDVEIGANVTVDRARFDKTLIGRGTKIDNLVQIAHNVVTGENCIIVAQAGLSGSTTLGKNVTLAGQAGISGHLNIGDGATVAAQAGVTKSIPPNTLVSGYPAKPHHTAKKINACVQNLPRLYNSISQLKKRIEELESKLNG